jgi:hypothetical protein
VRTGTLELQLESSAEAVSPGCGPPRRSRKEAAFALASLAAWQVGLLVSFLIEARRLRIRLIEQATAGNWFHQPDLDGTWFLPLLMLAPFCLLWTGRTPFPKGMKFPRGGKIAGGRIEAGCLILVMSCSLAVSLWAGRARISEQLGGGTFAEHLPIVHDEFSYLLQARTILSGRWSWEGPSRAPELFHQLHVLNEVRFASRYPPGTGAWIAPWLAIGHPRWGHLLAGMLICAGIFLIGKEFGGWPAGLIAGLLTAFAPGMGLLNNLLLAHQPGLVGLVVFLFGFLRFQRTSHAAWLWIAGPGLGYSMLCRPMTAAAVAFPFGVWLLVQNRKFPKQSAIVLALGLPIATAGVIQLVQNRAITGNMLTSPYLQYTRLYTPRHAYGFQQTESPALNPRQHQSLYDAWAQENTVDLAVKNFWHRLKCSFQWTLGIVPLLLAAVIFIGTLPWQDSRLRLIFASIVSLHAAHVPYWLDGMLGYHYVFESGPFWLVIFAAVSMPLLRQSWARGAWLFPIWWVSLTGLAVAGNLVSFDEAGASRLDRGAEEFVFPARGYQRFQQALTTLPEETPVLVLVHSGEEELHIQFVRNLPPFDSRILVATDHPEQYTDDQLLALFPERQLFRYDATTGKLTAIHQNRRPGEVDHVP